MIDPTTLNESSRGQRLYYIPAAGSAEVGILSSWNGHVIFARFTTGSTAAACDPFDLFWALPSGFNRGVSDRTRA